VDAKLVEKLKLAVEHEHACAATFLHTVWVKEQFEGTTVWEGSVTVFEMSTQLTHAKRCYEWVGKGAEQFVSVLELPPTDSAQRAVRLDAVFRSA
jgi:hypothetical protein